MAATLLVFPDVPTAASVLQPLGFAFAGPTGATGPAAGPFFAGNIILNTNGPNNGSVQVVTTAAVYSPGPTGGTGFNPPVLATPAVLAPGWWCWFVGLLPDTLQQYASAAAAASANAVNIGPTVLGE